MEFKIVKDKKLQPEIWGLLKNKKSKSGKTTEELLEKADKGWYN